MALGTQQGTQGVDPLCLPVGTRVGPWRVESWRNRGAYRQAELCLGLGWWLLRLRFRRPRCAWCQARLPAHFSAGARCDRCAAGLVPLLRLQLAQANAEAAQHVEDMAEVAHRTWELERARDRASTRAEAAEEKAAELAVQLEEQASGIEEAWEEAERLLGTLPSVS